MDENNNNTMMQPETFQDLSRQIIAANGDQGQITALLTQMQDGFTSLFATHAQMAKDNQTLTEENGKLKQYNLDLFMRTGMQTSEKQEQTQQKPNDNKSRAQSIKIADLFKEEK